MKKLLFFLFAATAAFAQPANNDCSGALIIPVNDGFVCDVNIEATLAGATLSEPTEECATDAQFDVWFQFTATATRHKVTYNILSGTIYNLQSVLYTGSCSGLTLEGCLTPSGLMTGLTPGQTYYIKTYTYTVSPDPQNTVFTTCINVPPTVITTSATEYTPEQLVTDVLINSQCVNVSNISYVNGSDGVSVGGLGYFNGNGSNLQFAEGVILSTGNIDNAPGINNGPTSTTIAGWGSDADLAEIMAANGNQGNFFNATVLEFDFIPLIDYISFDFLFASKEYGTFQCGFADAFAFILTDQTSGTETNLAVIPGTTTPVSVVTIRNSNYNGSCSSENPEYFDSFYTYLDVTAPVNFNGLTVPMTASSQVTPGNPYHIKLVIADYSDALYDSAVFLEAGSFNIGAPEEAELTSSTGTILCEGESTTLNINLPESFNFSWHHDGELMEGETGNSITATAAGEYSVTVSFVDSACNLNYSVTILEGDSSGTAMIPVSDYVAFEANSDGDFTFDLAWKKQQILNSINAGEPLITLHNTLADAVNGMNALGNSYINTSNPELLYVRLENPVSGCFTIADFYIVVLDENYTTPAPQGDDDQFFNEGDTLDAIEVTGENIQWYANDVTGGRNTTDEEQPLPLSTLLVDGTTYYASQTVWGIESATRLAVTVHLALNTNDAAFTGFSSYPNPVHDALYIKNNSIINSVTILNLLGQRVSHQNVNSENAMINMQPLSNGIYLVKVTSGEGEKTIKVVKE